MAGFVLVFSLLLLYGTYDTGRVFSNPAKELPPINCRQLTEGELRKKGYIPEGKAAPYSIVGESICAKGIFNYGERSSYVDFVTHYAHASAELVGQALIEFYSRPEIRSEVGSVPLVIDTSSISDPYLSGYLKDTMTDVVISKLGSGAVSRQVDRDLIHRKFKIFLYKVNDPDILFDYRLSEEMKPQDRFYKWFEL